ncbi:pantoate--beta-alanine ligase [Moraxella sp. ZY210820]|uniref:pantoate--beta-alanine ligase n=1 Tax=unclassified Moraxella TaxID=2685852 RepID=UPI002730119E|nr:pantoate--beta-alanine ligase [Moraxella sp. ZY210820]WLF84313.1 pantoate--beta-alanine ligase [Moraxella sp. ZY210820]
MQIIHQISSLRNYIQQQRQVGKRIGFVPTMGNLHDGHLTLVKTARQSCDVVVVSIFVNPTQFGVGEDFDSYPRTLQQDCTLVEQFCDVVFAPSIEEMYGTQPRLTQVSVSGITQDLCGASRPTHFDGVALVVSKLFNIVQADEAFFGEKDYQQLAVIRQMVQDLNIPIEIIGVPIVRADDGLALSSRNGYLTAEQRQIAPQIYQNLQQAKSDLQQGKALNQVLLQMRQNLQQAGFDIDYIEARTPQLQPVDEFKQDIVLFVAAKLGKPRLIDNLFIPFV